MGPVSKVESDYELVFGRLDWPIQDDVTPTQVEKAFCIRCKPI